LCAVLGVEGASHSGSSWFAIMRILGRKIRLLREHCRIIEGKEKICNAKEAQCCEAVATRRVKLEKLAPCENKQGLFWGQAPATLN
jgi:hypothetical protein